MQNKTLSSKTRLGALGLAAATLGLITGCGVHTADIATAPVITPGAALRGTIYGGQQPVSGATIQLYAASTAGYGSASYSLLNTAVTSDANGNFSITGDYTCPSSSSLVYIAATGGNPGAGVNASLAMMTALGACGNLTPSTFVTINELTTVASVYALSPFMTALANVGTSATNVAGLTSAFAAAGRIANLGTGQLPGALPAGATAPTAEINTLADILASCVNSTGASSSQCTSLFTAATPSGGVAPTDTVMAALDIARNPGHNVSTLYPLATPTAPFQPTLSSAPTDFTISIKYKPALSNPVASAIDAAGRVWITNTGSNSVSVIDASGTPVTGSPFTGSLNTPSGVAIDAGGNAWVTSRTNSTLVAFSPAGAPTVQTGVNLSSPTSVQIDGQGLLWITNSGDSSVSRVTVSGTTVSSSQKFTGIAGVNTPVAVAINPY